ncbi:acylneuraminate cytidylyltransferase family protein [Pseudomonas sp. JI-2]|nr:acylneuraminate cytidylyltransferase family protein [Pseudomonas sp. JI-2]
MNKLISCFLPCRRGSERVPRKNIKPFAYFPNGLIQVKLKQLLACKLIDNVLVSSDDDEILTYADGLNENRIVLHERDGFLATSQTSTDALVGHALSLIPEGHILWTHVTSPFINEKIYEQVIRCYLQRIDEDYDSLMTTTEIHGFLWQDNQPLNYDRNAEKWPRTQTLKPVHEVNSGVFLASAEVYRNCNDRIGVKPYLYKLGKLVSSDIDWPEDFALAECIVEKGLVRI